MGVAFCFALLCAFQLSEKLTGEMLFFFFRESVVKLFCGFFFHHVALRRGVRATDAGKIARCQLFQLPDGLLFTPGECDSHFDSLFFLLKIVDCNVGGNARKRYCADLPSAHNLQLSDCSCQKSNLLLKCSLRNDDFVIMDSLRLSVYRGKRNFLWGREPIGEMKEAEGGKFQKTIAFPAETGYNKLILYRNYIASPGMGELRGMLCI